MLRSVAVQAPLWLSCAKTAQCAMEQGSGDMQAHGGRMHRASSRATPTLIESDVAESVGVVLSCAKRFESLRSFPIVKKSKVHYKCAYKWGADV